MPNRARRATISVMTGRFGLLFATLARSGVRAAGPALGPVYVGVFIGGAVLFGPSGMTARDACQAMRGAPWVGAALWLAWLLALLPGVRALVGARDAAWLRSQPVPGWWLWLSQGALLFAAEGPWILLWGRGEGPLVGAAAGLVATALHAAAVSRAPGLGHRLAALAAGLAWLAPAPFALGAGALVAPVVVRAAWRHAHSASAPLRSARLRGGATLALAQLIGLAWLRARRARLVRSGLWAALGAGMSVLGAVNNHLGPERAVVVSLSVGGACLVLALAGLARDTLAAEADLAWLTASSGVAPRVRVGASLLAMLAAGLGLGVLHAAVVGPLCLPGVAPIARLLGLWAGWGAGLAAFVYLGLRSVEARAPAGKSRAFWIIGPGVLASILAPSLAGEAAVGWALAGATALCPAVLLGRRRGRG